MRIILFSSLLLLLAAACGAPAARAQQTLTVDDAVALGLERSHRLQAMQAQADEAAAAARIARSNLFPALRTRANYTRLSDNIPTGDFSLPGLDTTITLLPIPLNQVHSEISIEQPLFTGFRVRNEIRSASRAAGAAALMAEQEAADVALEIRQAYWRLVEAVSLLEATDAGLRRVEEHLRHVGNLVEEGVALRSERLAARTRRAEVMLDRVEARNGVRVARLELSRLTGADLPDDVVLVDEFEATPDPADVAELTRVALERRPQLRALDEQIAARRFELRATRGAWLPQASAVGRIIYARPNPYFFTEQDELRRSGEVGLTLQWNLFEGGRRSATTARVRSQLTAAEARRAEAHEQVEVEVARRYFEAQRAEQALDVAALNVEEAEESFRVVRMQFQEGVARSGEVLDAELAYRSALARQARSVADYAIARAALLNVTGRVR